MQIRILGGTLWIFGSKWTLELYLERWQPEAARLFGISESFSRVRGLTGEETRIAIEGIRPLVEIEVTSAPGTHGEDRTPLVE